MRGFSSATGDLTARDPRCKNSGMSEPETGEERHPWYLSPVGRAVRAGMGVTSWVLAGTLAWRGTAATIAAAIVLVLAGLSMVWAAAAQEPA